MPLTLSKSILHSSVTEESEQFIRINPKKVTLYLSCIIVFLVLAHLSGMMLKEFFNNGIAHLYFRYFDLSDENNFPSYFSALILFIASALNFVIYLISKTETSLRRNRSNWFILSIIFLYLSTDESLQLHENLNSIKKFLPSDLSGFLYYAWVIPYAVLVIFCIFFFARFLFQLPSKTRILFILSGFIYVSGALGFEFLEGHVVELYGTGNKYDVLFYILEETFEMIGVTLFIHALLDYISRFNLKLTVAKVVK